VNTPAHLLLGAAVFARPDDPRRTWGAVLGGFAPDLSLYLMAGVAIGVMGIPPERVFGTLYYSAAWQGVFAVDNSIVLWGIGCALAIRAGSGWAVALTGAALLHLATDLLLHGQDARMQFWPLTDWKFYSPLSYWDGTFGRIWTAIEMAGALGLAVALIRQPYARVWRVAFGVIALAELAPLAIWSVMF